MQPFTAGGQLPPFNSAIADHAMALMMQQRFGEAEQLLAATLQREPHNHPALHVMALLACQFKRFDVAAPLATEASRLAPAQAGYWVTLGRVYKGLGQMDAAESALVQALQRDPSLSDAHVLLGMVHKAQGHLDEAIASYQAALALRPDFPEAQVNLGNALREKGEAERATALYQQAVQGAPQLAEAQSALTASLLMQGREREALDQLRGTLDSNPDRPHFQFLLGLLTQQQGGAASDAIGAYSRVLAEFPDHADAWVNLGVALVAEGRAADAVACYQKALDIAPNHVAGLNNYSLALAAYSRHPEAIEQLRKAVEADPQHRSSLINLGGVLIQNGQLDEAERVLRRAVELNPDSVEARTNLGASLRAPGRLRESVDILRAVIADHPDHVAAHDNLLFSMLYADGITADEFVAAAHACSTAPVGIVPPTATSAHGRRLRIGYVSPDLRRHSVAYFVEPVLANHDRTRFEIFCYHLSPLEDDVSERLRGHSDHWFNAHGLGTEAVAQRIRADGIDILVDLAGRTGQHHLAVFAARPAAVQMTWLGFPSTVGEPAIDYRLTDWHVDPEGYERHNVETPLRLPRSYFCYRPGSAPAIAPRPSTERGEIVFGSFNNLMKVSETTLDLWARVLLAVPNSRLLLKNKVLAEAANCDLLRRHFAAAGVDPARLDLHAWMPEIASHLELYNRVDIALDTFPYNGATTTCEALWMGVPVVSRCGGTHQSRMGLSILTAVGHPEWVADSDQTFVDIAVAIANDASQRGNLRSSLREQLQASPLADETAFTRALEANYSQAWDLACARGAGGQ
jgi:predicted O-linked N-acetylglucosamine transferase (SPINDLY family)